jgi:hypothetical protein
MRTLEQLISPNVPKDEDISDTIMERLQLTTGALKKGFQIVDLIDRWPFHAEVHEIRPNMEAVMAPQGRV